MAAHLLGGSIGRLRSQMDISVPAEKPQVYNELVNIINRENELGVQATRRISPEILIEFLELTDRRL